MDIRDSLTRFKNCCFQRGPFRYLLTVAENVFGTNPKPLT